MKVTDDPFDVAFFVKPLIFAILRGTIFCLHCGLVGLAWHVEQGSYHSLILSCSFTAHQMEISLDGEIIDFGPTFI